MKPFEEITLEDIANYTEGNANMALEKLGLLSKETKELTDKRKAICLECVNLIQGACLLCGCPFPDLTYATKKKCPDNPSQW